MSFTSRQRVLAAIEHREPDRVPTALGGGPYGMVDAVYFKLLEHLKLGEPVQPFRQGHSISYMDDRMLERLGTDFRYVYPGALPNSPTQTTDDPDTFLDSFGQPWKRAVPYYYATKGKLSQATEIEQIDEWIAWPDVHDPRWTDGVSKRARHLRETTECWVTARMVASHGPYQTACDLRGTEEFMLDMAGDPEFAQALLERITDNLVGLTQGYLKACGEYIDMIELPGDDYAGNTNLIMSPAMFRRFIRPCILKMVETIKAFRPDLKIMLHSDGAIQRLLPDIIGLGIDVIHPLEPLPAMDLDAIKAEFGGQIAFLGGIDISHAMPGTKQQVINEARLRIRQLAPGGGYILAPANHLQVDVPAENVAVLFETARQYGQYPLS